MCIPTALHFQAVCMLCLGLVFFTNGSIIKYELCHSKWLFSSLPPEAGTP